ncbi:MAG TPA: hypothetical protein PK393_05160 [Synergistaceae bacterium]|nr:hypothetical protein [Synergistaceae bacterium]HQH77979.1 hypothetical protein [Synergistaceae bacterium]HQK24893.1 hypothetical protein [Synergistaceae bacterium]
MEPQDVLKTVRSLAHLDLSRMDEGTREQVASVLTFALESLRKDWLSPEEGAQELRVSPRRFRAILKRYQILEQQRLALENIEREEERFIDTIRELTPSPSEGVSGTPAMVSAPEEPDPLPRASGGNDAPPEEASPSPEETPAEGKRAPQPAAPAEGTPPAEIVEEAPETSPSSEDPEEDPFTDAPSEGPSEAEKYFSLEEESAQMAQALFAAVQHSYDDELRRLRLAVERLSSDGASHRHQFTERLEIMNDAYHKALDSLVARATEERHRGEEFFSSRCEDFARSVHITAANLREENAVLRNKFASALREWTEENDALRHRFAAALQEWIEDKERYALALRESADRCRLLEERMETLRQEGLAARGEDRARQEAREAQIDQTLGTLEERWQEARGAAEELNRRLDRETAELGRRMDQGTAEMSHRLEQSSAELNRRLEQETAELRQRLDQGQGDIAQRVETLRQEDRAAGKEERRRFEEKNALALERLRKEAEDALRGHRQSLREEMDALRSHQQEELQAALTLVAGENGRLMEEMDRRQREAGELWDREISRNHAALSQKIQHLAQDLGALQERSQTREAAWRLQDDALQGAVEDLRKEMARFQAQLIARESDRDGAMAEEGRRREEELHRSLEEALQDVRRRIDAGDQLREERHGQMETRWKAFLEETSRETARQAEAIARIREEKMSSNVEIAKSQQFQGQMLKMIKTDLMALSSEAKKDLAQLKERCVHLERHRTGEEGRFAGEIAAVERRLAAVDALKSALQGEVQKREVLTEEMDRLGRYQQGLSQDLQDRERREAEERDALAKATAQLAETVESFRDKGEALEREVALHRKALGKDFDALRESWKRMGQELALQQKTFERGLDSLRQEGLDRQAEERHRREELASELRSALGAMADHVEKLRVSQAPPPPKGAIDWLFGEKPRE